jgi:hypothetical protein
MERQQMERCLERVGAYRASGQKANVWAQANGVPMRQLASWCAHAARWQARLDGVSAVPRAATRPSGFVAARVASNATASTSIRVEFSAGPARLELHWPVAHTRELGALLREFSR